MLAHELQLHTGFVSKRCGSGRLRHEATLGLALDDLPADYASAPGTIDRLDDLDTFDVHSWRESSMRSGSVR